MIRRLLLCVLLVVLAIGILPAQPMGGTYTIRPSGGDFNSFGAACSALSSRGYTRACTMLCYTGTYTTWGDARSFSSDSVPVVFKAAPGNRPLMSRTALGNVGFSISGTDNLTLDSIWFSTYSHCLYGSGFKKLTVRNCSLVTTGTGYGWDVHNADSSRFENNVVNGVFGCYFAESTRYNVIIGNKLYARGSYGIYLYDALPKKRNTFINNFVTGYTKCGMWSRCDTLTRLYFNSFYSTDTQPCLYLDSSLQIRALNNIFHAGSGYCFRASVFTRVDTSNYNCLYTTGPYVGHIGTPGMDITFAAWQAYGFDRNSINRPPGYVAPPDLHVVDTSACIGAGISYGGVTVDIDGETRRSPPCIGADEHLRLHNVGVSMLLEPTGTMDSSASVVPACSVRNRGAFTESYKVRLRIGASYTDSTNVTGHAPGTGRFVSFPAWTANLARGTHAVSCSTELVEDANPGDDKQADSVTVLVKDVGVVSIAVPAGSYPKDTFIRPRATWRNYGTQNASFEAWALLSDSSHTRVYAQKLDLTDLMPGDSVETGAFPPCTLKTPGAWTVRCSTLLTGDSKRANDTLGRAFTVVRLDMAVRAILAPAGSFDTAVAVTPTARLKNLGDAPAADVKVFFRIDSTPGNIVYQDSATRNFAAGESANVAFVEWRKPHNPRAYSARCSAFVAGDPAPGNNVLSASFTVTMGARPPGAWAARTPMPSGTKPIKDGGWLAYDVSTARVYASRGNKQPDFFAYAPPGDSWVARAPWLPGAEGKLPQKGSAGCADGSGHVYATKGNGTSGFYGYDAARDSWRQMKDVPLGLSNKKVKGGTDIVWAYNGGVGSPYLLKGYKNEFYRYDVAGDSWQTLLPAPMGGNVKWDKGSWLASDGAHTIYAFKAKYMEFYSYNTETHSWSAALSPMPITGSTGSKKAKAGSCGTFIDGSVYALKGGNTQQFFQHTIATNSWAERETIPKGVEKKKANAGTDITTAGLSLYALKGNKSNQLWQYVPGSFAFEAPRPDGVAASSLPTPHSSFLISPNPLASGFTTLSFARPLDHSTTGPLVLSLFGISGRQVFRSSFELRTSSFRLDLRSLPAGVYLVKLTAGSFTATQKLVVER